MIRGIFTSATGMGTQQAKMDSISNNLSNIAANGYKKDMVLQSSFTDLLLIQQTQDANGKLPPHLRIIGATGQGAAVNDVVTDFSPGVLNHTGNNTDMALENETCFFTVSAPTPGNPGRICYTRDGSFHIDREGYLANSLGHRLLGEGGPVRAYNDDFQVTPEGNLITGQNVVKLRIAQFEDLSRLKKQGDNYYTADDIAPVSADAPGVVQGSLEKSNVDLAAEMVEVIEVRRNYEANQKLIQAHDQLLDLAVNRVGSLK